ncbi:nuclear transport factor 2 family protein [Actinomadura sp. HBU206391]|uniref:YybH family protein n=1 Tax=Actinomadura sp. HBU206391 TaxID=2731692 RepID=UPI0016507403|nr:nuclear transport factor 2 family protein [Actinomadura sp. HBU206391]
MPADEEEIRTLIEHWTEAVHRGDMSGVLADHAKDIVMFDVPPPYEGVRGIDAYREAWPSFFEWQRQGALFEIESLDVTAGDDVAYAHALLRCGTQEQLADKRPPRPGDRGLDLLPGHRRISVRSGPVDALVLLRRRPRGGGGLRPTGRRCGRRVRAQKSAQEVQRLSSDQPECGSTGGTSRSRPAARPALGVPFVP